MSLESEELVSLAIQTMSDWVSANGWIFEGNYKTDTSTLYMLFDALTISMGGKDPNEEISSNSSMSSQTSISYLSSSGQGTPTPPPTTGKDQDKETSAGKDKDKDKEKDKEEAPPKVRKLANPARVPAKVRESAQTALQTVLTRMGNYPNPYNANQMDTSSTFVEVDIVEQIRERAKLAGEPDFPVEQCIRFYTIEGIKLMTLIDQPFGNEQSGGQPFSTIIIRDSTGRYVINTDLSLVALRPKLDGLTPPLADDQVMSDGEGGGQDEFVPTLAGSGQGGAAYKDQSQTTGLLATASNQPYISKYADNCEQFDDITNYLSRHPDEQYTKYIQDLVASESKSLQECQYGLNFAIAVSSQVLGNRYAGDCKFQQSRMLLASLGFFNLENKGRLCPMDNTSSFYQSLRSLDSVSERVQSRVAVYYAKRGDITEEDVIANQTANTSHDYREFVASLGWTVDVEKHSGYLGGLDRRFSSGRVAQYYATSTKEMAFHVASLMPHQDSVNPLEQKKKILSRSQMSVVWCESIEDYEKELRPKADLLSKYSFQLAVEPKASGLFRIKTIHSNSQSKISFGPVLEEMTVSKHILAPLIKATLGNANNYLLASEHRLIHPFAQRRRLIADISDSFRSELRVMQNFQNVFLPLEEDRLYRPPPIPLISSDDVPIFKPVRPTNKQRPISVQLSSPIIPIQPLSLSSTGAVTSGGGNPRIMPTPPVQINKTNTSPSMQPLGSPSSKNWGGLKPTSPVASSTNQTISNPNNPSPGLRGNFLTRNRSINLSDDQSQSPQ
ncbi:RapGAP/RanGAP domain-containing protein [Cavenderia fasciculata]|uniref:RapGAP/RanGAP domain-containing protein n=1 Tax=Cavenderia fasciculata TaxID=261658 RepID=F4PZW6_CACFS|nr:RapGAP/RanGAP domain-containing protein [Cavenderia fasciculata]EGG18880.1 RapGAP/RanGAP domain-containing protein [Cavenderia fasciculata]|eukprot:XP_004357342.1 RapGAP/RanGAP domain-containing protein [Cavenderia fasciculata]